MTAADAGLNVIPGGGYTIGGAAGIGIGQVGSGVGANIYSGMPPMAPQYGGATTAVTAPVVGATMGGAAPGAVAVPVSGGYSAGGVAGAPRQAAGMAYGAAGYPAAQTGGTTIIIEDRPSRSKGYRSRSVDGRPSRRAIYGH